MKRGLLFLFCGALAATMAVLTVPAAVRADGTHRDALIEDWKNDSLLEQMILGEKAFYQKPCIPAAEAPPDVKYRPTMSECKGNAAVILSGRFLNAFSVVVRKRDNGDRLGNNCAASRCSPFKVQKKIRTADGIINCLGASGFSKVFNGTDPYQGYNPAFVVSRITIKLKNGDPNAILRYCLPKPYPKTPLN